MPGPSTNLISIFTGRALVLNNVNSFSRDFPKDGFWAKLLLRFKFVLTNTTGTGALSEGELQIVKKITFRTDKGEYPVLNCPARFLYRVDEKKSSTPAVKDAASATAGTFYIDIPIYFIDPLSRKPLETIFDSTRYDSVQLDIDMGGVANWLGTVGDSAITATLDCYYEPVDTIPAVRPTKYLQFGTTTPVDPSSSTVALLEKKTAIDYKRLYVFTTNSASTGVTHSGAANSSVISQLDLETNEGYLYKTVLSDMINRRNKQDFRLETRTTGEYTIDLVKDGDSNRAIKALRYSKLQINWTNDTLSTSQVSVGYEALKDLAA